MTMRVLALCGFTQNAHIYSKQLGAIRKTCKEVEFTFLEPPIIVEKADLPWSTADDGADLDKFGSSAQLEPETQTAETTPRAWWTTADSLKTYKQFDETVTYLHDYLVKNGPFDGIMGFSQGAAMAALLAAMLEKPNLHPNFPSEPTLPKFKFVICVGGFLPVPDSPDFTPYFPLPSHLPVLHVVGRNDTLVTQERSQTLVEKCLNSRMEIHEGGHFTPSKASWRHFFNAYITSFVDGGSQGDIPGPAAYGPSGANTPATASGTPRASTPA